MDIKLKTQPQLVVWVNLKKENNKYLDLMGTVFELITATALITPPPLLFTLFSLIITHLTIFFTYYRPLDDFLALVVENKFM